MAIPIVFIHSGPARFLAGSITQARQSNPESEIFLLGDRFNTGLRPARHFDCAAFSEGAGQFDAVYQHRSTHGADYEGFCFKRWLILQSFLERQKIERCVYLDSDVLFFSDATQEARRFEKFDLTLSSGSPHCMFINHKAALDRYCALLMECYVSPKLFAGLEVFYQGLREQNKPGGVCDMTMFGLYQQLGRGAVADLCEIRDDTTYDHAMPDPGGYEMQNGIKKIHWLNGMPHGRRTADGKSIRFHTLHFQGGSKRFINAHLRLPSLRLKLLHQWNRLAAERGKLMIKLERRKSNYASV